MKPAAAKELILLLDNLATIVREARLGIVKEFDWTDGSLVDALGTLEREISAVRQKVELKT